MPDALICGWVMVTARGTGCIQGAARAYPEKHYHLAGVMAMGTENLMTTKAALVVGTAGHVWVAASTKQDADWLHLTRARIVRVWGTDAGLNQLVDGPRTETVLDRSAPIVSVAWHAVIAVIPVDNSAWERHL